MEKGYFYVLCADGFSVDVREILCENVYKIGKTKSISQREKGYNNPIIIYECEVPNITQYENFMKKLFKRLFILYQGREWVFGNPAEMMELCLCVESFLFKKKINQEEFSYFKIFDNKLFFNFEPGDLTSFLETDIIQGILIILTRIKRLRMARKRDELRTLTNFLPQMLVKLDSKQQKKCLSIIKKEINAVWLKAFLGGRNTYHML